MRSKGAGRSHLVPGAQVLRAVKSSWNVTALRLVFPSGGDEIRAPAESHGLGLVGPESVVRRECKRIRSSLAEVADFSGGRADVKGVFAG